MWKEKLEEIKREKNKYGELLNIGAANKEIDVFMNKVKDKFNYLLPNDYLDFLKKVNGLEVNGFILYGIDEELLSGKINQTINGFISSNEIWYENEEQKRYMFIGESNISWYVYDLENNMFAELDNPSGRKIVQYKDFYSMLERILADSLL